MKSLAKNKSPQWDGIPSEFFQECYKEIQLQLVRVVQEMMDTGSLSGEVNRGLITLIPKEGDLTLVTNYRPITLMGSFYRLMAKIMASRLQPLLPSIVRPHQTGYVQGRSILDNIFLAQEAMS